MKKVLYQKTYPPVDCMFTISESIGNKSLRSAEEFMRNSNNVVMEQIQERKGSAQIYINTAIRLSEEYEIDLLLEKKDCYISAAFTTECGPCPEALKPLFILADRYFFTVCSDHRLLITLDYFTHKVVRNGHILAPIGLETEI